MVDATVILADIIMRYTMRCDTFLCARNRNEHGGMDGRTHGQPDRWMTMDDRARVHTAGGRCI